MRRSTALPELLAPAGSYEAMLAAVEGGADAVYMGGPAFGARAYAKNFDEDALADAVRYCHLHDVRVYVTVNTQLYDREMDEAVGFCRRLYGMGVDAVIIADLGLVRRLRRELPQLPLHASTQMSMHNTEGVRMAHALGMERAVVARELTLEDMRSIVKQSPLPIEVFVHGALCVCHSGQCLFSSLVGGRSGNRGECAQPCRLPYNGQSSYPLSLKDMCLARHIPALIKAGVASLKIEGRMKSPSYVLGVTRMYRRLLDERRGATDYEEAALADLFSRDGFTDAYLRGATQERMTGVRRAQDKARTRETEGYTPTPWRVRVRAEGRFVCGEPCSLTLFDEHRRVTVTGDVPAEAQNIPLNFDDLTTRLCKMGGTYLALSPQDVTLTLDDELFLSPAAVNALRRAAAQAFVDASRPIPRQAEGAPEPLPPYAPTLRRTAQLFDAGVLRGLPRRLTDAFDVIFVPLMQYASEGVARGVTLPPVITDTAWERTMAALAAAAREGATHALISNLSHLAPVQACGLIPVGDLRLNICNRESAALWRSLGVTEYILSAELTLPMARDIGGGLVCCGRVPLMLTERCFIRETGGCERCGHSDLVDRRGKHFPIRREWEHRNVIFNSAITYMGDRRDALRRAGITHEHMLITVEDAAEATRLLNAYLQGDPLSGSDIRRI